MAAAPERPASNQRDTIKDAELIVSVMSGDIDRIHRLVLAALALAAVFVTQIPLSQLRALPEAFQVLTVIAIGLLASAAVLLFAYTQKLNLRRLQLAQAALWADLPHDMHTEWGANFDDPGNLWDRAKLWGRPAVRLGDREEAPVQEAPVQKAREQKPREQREQTRTWVRPLTYGNLLLGAGGLLLGLVVARLLLG
jgi:hypothetical protein